MNEKDDSALVPRPPGALEKAEPGKKRILSDMAADTLALVRKEAPTKPVFTVLIGHRGGIGDSWEFVIKQKLEMQYDLRFFRFADDSGFYPGPDNCYRTEFLNLVAEQPFDLIVVYSHMAWGELQLFARLRVEYGKPVIACSDLLYNNTESCSALKEAGVNVLPLPYSIEQFIVVLDSCLEPDRNAVSPREIAAQPHRTRPLRIVVVDDESFCLEIFALLIRDWFKDVTLVEFSNSSDAWQELLQTDPDLLILDMPLTGMEMLPLLAEKKVKYPILVTSGFYGEKEMRRQADPSLSVSCLMKPFSSEQLFQELLVHVGPSDNPQRKIWKSEP